MQRKALTLAVVTLLAFGASGAVAASIGPSPSAATAQSPAADASPANYTVEVTDPYDRLSAGEVETAWQVAWKNDTVRNHFEDDSPVHFEVWAPQPDENRVVVSVELADEPDSARVLATVHLDNPAGERVSDVKEPTPVTSNGTFSVESGEYHSVDTGEPTEFETGGSITIAVSSGNVDPEGISVRLASDNQTAVTEEGNTTQVPAE
ncbi:hypothetical protein [Halocalculus aciditolerans]|uniref:Uncharacterized protein n=1 Tax=Halocalculus aciditolerans TaxID=1383812 RepID=A0A830FL55_9EURY|nr:hypothetical protein [Halocalculus aciditolerans]GGL66674.1 hypothetical protein GCM10009039_25770 [Halocalculus aciditolerans]